MITYVCLTLLCHPVSVGDNKCSLENAEDIHDLFDFLLIGLDDVYLNKSDCKSNFMRKYFSKFWKFQ